MDRMESCRAVLYFGAVVCCSIQIVSLESLSILDLGLSGVKGLILLYHFFLVGHCTTRKIPCKGKLLQVDFLPNNS